MTFREPKSSRSQIRRMLLIYTDDSGVAKLEQGFIDEKNTFNKCLSTGKAYNQNGIIRIQATFNYGKINFKDGYGPLKELAF